MKGLKITETDIKRQIKDYLAIMGIFNFHILQALGAYKGIPDRILHYRQRVVYLEIKKPPGILSDNQLAFQAQCRQDGIDYWVVRSVEELQSLIEVHYDAPQSKTRGIKSLGSVILPKKKKRGLE